MAQREEKNNYGPLVIGGSVVLGAGAILYYLWQKDKNVTDQGEAGQALLKTYQKAANELPEWDKQTRPDVAWATVASNLYGFLKNSALTDDKTKATQLLKEPFKTGDVYRLILEYGERQHYLAPPVWPLPGVPDGPTRTLPNMVAEELSADQIKQINDDYTRKGINFRW